MLQSVVVGLVVLGMVGMGAYGTMMVMPGFGHNMGMGANHMGLFQDGDCDQFHDHSLDECENYYDHVHDEYCEEYHDEFSESETGMIYGRGC